MKAEVNLVKDDLGFIRLDPIPSKEELDEFYREKYFSLAEVGKRAPEIKRQKAGGEEARLELEWLDKTLHYDIAYTLNHLVRRRYRKRRSLLDIGSGTGAFMRCMASKKWNVTGIEPSEEGAHMSDGSRVVVHNTSLENFVSSNPRYRASFDAVTLLNVLEHVPDPLETLRMAKSLLRYNRVICIRVPNDFSELQVFAEAKLNKGKWWVVSPDHINYFNFHSLRNLLETANLEIIFETTDFPMELFLLMGEDYVGNPEIGTQCHNKRKSFEMSIPPILRQEIYCSLAQANVGRSCIVFAKIKSREVRRG